MKRLIILLFVLFYGAVHAQTIDIDWLVDNSVYNQSTCEYGGDLIVPTAPTKYGYTFNGWVSYTPIEYLESTGTQWIDTGFAWDNTIEFEIKLEIRPSQGTWSYFGAYNFWSSNGKCLPLISSYLGYRIAGNFQSGGSSLHDIGIRNNQIGIVRLRNNTCSWDLGSSFQFDRGSYFQFDNLNIVLFAVNVGGRVQEAVKTKLYFAKFWLQGVLVRDFIPVLDRNGTPCMFDKVEGKFYYNAGTGDFIAGPVITD